MIGQMTIFDWMPSVQEEPEVGAWVEHHGAVISGIMRRGYIGKKVVMDKSTTSHKWYKVGILENVLIDHYWDGDREIICDRSIIFDGSRQRSSILHMPGQNIYECLPWDAYPERMAAIGNRR